MAAPVVASSREARYGANHETTSHEAASPGDTSHETSRGDTSHEAASHETSHEIASPGIANPETTSP